MGKKFLILFLIAGGLGLLGFSQGLTAFQSAIVTVFFTSILGTLFFWDFRLSFVFVGSGILLLMGAVNIDTFIRFASLDVILFLISMMIIVGMMKEAGFFTWLITLVLRVKRLTGIKLFAILMAASAVLSGLMGEVASIIVTTLVILDVGDFFEINPVPLVIASVLATNIGSAGTVLGNPVGVLIAARGQLSFEDFLTHAMPLSIFVLVVTIGVVCLWNRKYIADLNKKLVDFRGDSAFLYLISIPPDIRTRISMAIFGVTIFLIALHRRLELFLGLEENTLLIMIPVISAGIVMFYRHDKARYYIEHEVEWPSILFFMFLFAQAGVIQASGIAAFAAEKIVGFVGDSMSALTGTIMFTSGFLSSGLDNVVTVASYVPIVQSLELQLSLKPLWWALLFGACYGGNMTMIGSTANIVALGLMEKTEHKSIDPLMWLRIGLTVGVLSMGIAYGTMLLFPVFFS